MSAPFSQLEEKLEDALKSALESTDDPGIQVSRAFTDDPVVEPFVALLAESSTPTIIEEGPLTTGIRDVTVRLVIRSHGEPQEVEAGQGLTDARNAHALFVGRVLDVFMRDDFVAIVNAQGIADFTCQAVYVNDRTRSISDNSFVTEQILVVTCHAEGSTP